MQREVRSKTREVPVQVCGDATKRQGLLRIDSCRRHPWRKANRLSIGWSTPQIIHKGHICRGLNPALSFRVSARIILGRNVKRMLIVHLLSCSERKRRKLFATCSNPASDGPA
jgi:hypothetical protein